MNQGGNYKQAYEFLTPRCTPPAAYSACTNINLPFICVGLIALAHITLRGLYRRECTNLMYRFVILVSEHDRTQSNDIDRLTVRVSIEKCRLKSPVGGK